MTDDLVTRLRRDLTSGLSASIGDTEEAAARIELLEYALRSIAETPVGTEIPDRTTIWGLAVHMRETATDALKEGKLK
jgi:hypothetical protein